MAGIRVRAALLALVLLGACTTGADPPGRAEDPGTARPAAATTTAPPGLQRGDWTLLRVSPDGTELVVGAHFGGCSELRDVQVDESATAVDVAVLGPVPERGDATCSAELRLEPAVIALDQPLDGRVLEGCGRRDCRQPADIVGEVDVPVLGVADLGGGAVALAGTADVLRWLDGDLPGRPPPAQGLTAIDAATGQVRWGTPYERADAEDPLGDAVLVDDLVAVDLTASGGLAVFDAGGAGPLALVDGMSGAGRLAAGGLWLGNQKLTSNLMALDLAAMADVWEGGRPANFAPSRVWAVDGEEPVAVLPGAPGAAADDVVLTRSGVGYGSTAPRVGARRAIDGADLGGGDLPAGTRGVAGGVGAAGAALVVGHTGVTLFAADPLTGDLRWQVDATGVGLPREVAVDDLAVLADGAGAALALVRHADELLALDAATGAERWRAPLPAAAPSSGGLVGADAPDGGRLLVAAGGDGTLTALDPLDGAVVWTAPVVDDQRFPVPVPRSLVAVGDVVVAGTDDGAVGIDAATGERRWQRTLAEALDG